MHMRLLPRCRDQFPGRCLHCQHCRYTADSAAGSHMIEEHTMHQARTLQTGLVAVAVVLVAFSIAQALGAGIHDAAGFFSTETVATAEQQIAAIRTKFGKDLRVETYAHIPTDRARCG